MSSQDTLAYAQSEDEKASELQHEIAKEQAGIEALQKDINNKSEVIRGLQVKQQEHTKEAQRLHQQATAEQKHEQEEQLRQRQNDKSFMEKAVREAARQSLF